MTQQLKPPIIEQVEDIFSASGKKVIQTKHLIIFVQQSLT
jgi:hypothetical protein